MRSRKKGFTLIELLVVISIIAMLLSIMMPSLSRAKELARRIVCSSNLKSLGTSVFVYANKNNDLLPPSYYKTGDPTYGQPSASYMLFYLYSNATESMKPKKRVEYTFNFGYLFMSDLIEDGEAFYCPSTPRPTEATGPYSVSYGYEQYCKGGTTFPWNNSMGDSTAWNPTFVRSSYNYIPQNGSEKKRVNTASGKDYFPKIAQKSFELNSAHVMACDYLFRKDMLPHKKGRKLAGLDALYSDGSVKFVNDPEAFDDALWGKDLNSYARVGNDEFIFRSIIRLLE